MKNRILFCLFVLVTNFLLAQVKVKGYYRKNGTYVQPHYRSSPDGNPYNNYSYPGNVNPYTGKVATGSESTYLQNYYNKKPLSTSDYSPPVNSYKYRAIVDASFNPPLRELPDINSKEVYKCEVGSIVYVIDIAGSLFYRVNVNGNIGYLSKSFIKEIPLQNSLDEKASPILINTSIKANVQKDIIAIKEYVPESNTYTYRTRIDASFDPPLRESPDINSSEIYICPKSSFIYVIDNSGELYFKVNVDGHIGYLSKSFIKDKH